MINYDNLISDVYDNIGEYRLIYDDQFKLGNIDDQSGPHTVFSVTFTPLLITAIKKNATLAEKMFDYLERMETEGDQHVSEVAEFTVLEEIADNFKRDDIVNFMGPTTLEAYNLISRYIVNI